MLSILIPVYNYDITNLIYEIHEQATLAKIEFEIICLDDKSNEDILKANLVVNELDNVLYKTSERNNGIAITRQHLCDSAKYDWILLIDADTELKDKTFIPNYLDVINSGFNVIFGGISYKNNKPDKKSLLRWKYGKQFEEVTAKKRNRRPYKRTSAANILIKKKLYQRFSLDSIGNSYGMDIFFGPQLKLNNIPVLHINNGVYHLGLEKSATYIKKTQRAVETLLNLHYQKKIKLHENGLLKSFLFFKKIKLNFIFSLWYKLFKNLMTLNLLSSNPSTKTLQAYKISYMCFFDLSNSTD
ncbi:glycosyltransferase family 2 protein [Flavivirga spongiicola]|uniref:Glycosyltransferase family 2 protein n=1 Tax=Flavivirga spongiicola TaxID=421621 RepID=A0ABU7XYW1_9FLAO|nr:glycosyltransferase [Flavivirga sp. MEBiC05379]MDO5980116.1 glycosyltransferase [Flavivirga sp. MEBiC05379]